MLTRYGEAARLESAKRAEELATDGDLGGVAVWLRIIDAIGQLAITNQLGRCIRRQLPSGAVLHPTLRG
jgi:hypothetical protein